LRHTAVVLMILVLFLQTPACTVRKTTRVAAPSVTNPASEKIVGVTTKKGEDVRFDPPGALVRDRVLEANVNKKPYQIALDQVERFWIEHSEKSTVRTVGLVAGIAVGTIAVAAIVIAATKESCPFIYSWNGEKYVFDAEPYGGAISRGLERDDYSELEQLVPDRGLYRLTVKNEVQETQFTNQLELLVADHGASRVALNDAGKLFTLSSVHPPSVAVDETGRDLLPWLKSNDRLIWEPEPETNPNAEVRQNIQITFPKPANAIRAKLVVNAATSLWGSYMIKLVSELRGSENESWHAAIDNNPLEAASVLAWNQREELFALKIDVQEPGGWVQRGILLGGGPFISEDRVVELDLGRVRGDRLNIRIRPPKGFWAFNSFGVDYSVDQAVKTQVLHPVEAHDSAGRDRLAEILSADNSYYEMPNVGDQGFITFKAPPGEKGLKRTVFLHARGYYQLHLDQTSSADIATLTSIMTTPDAAARFAGSRYAAWQAERAAQR
jgi:hypothetical protein